MIIEGGIVCDEQRARTGQMIKNVMCLIDKKMEGFNPTAFLYLNPELWERHACEQDMDNENAEWLYHRYSSPTAPLHVSLPKLPEGFDPEVYILSIAPALNIASLNYHIRKSMDSATGVYLPTIKQGVHVISTNSSTMTRFGFDDPYIKLTDWMLVEEDTVRIESASSMTCGTCLYHGRVCSVDYDNNTFEVCGLPRTIFTAPSTSTGSYILYGQLLYDYRRLAVINYARGARPASAGSQTDSLFNPDLYRILYPDTRHLSDREAFLDFRARRAQGEIRIGGANDMVVDDLSPYNELSYQNRVKIDWTSNQTKNILEKSLWSSNMVGMLSNTTSLTYALKREVMEDVRDLHKSIDATRCASLEKTAVGDVFVEGQLFVEKGLEVYNPVAIGNAGALSDSILLDVRGGIRAKDYLVASDMRIKTDIAVLDSRHCLDVLKRMQVVQFRYKSDASSGSSALSSDTYGFIAQDLEKIDSNLVTYSTGFVPNILRDLSVDKSGHVELPIQVDIGTKLRLICKEERKDGLGCGAYAEVIATVRKLTENGAFVDDVDQKVYGKTHLFYGSQVDDFMSIRSSHILAVLVGGMQHLIHQMNRP